MRVSSLLQNTKSVIDLLSINFPQKLRARKTIAVFAGHRTTEAEDKSQRRFGNFAQLALPLRRLYIQDGSHVQASRRGMSVENTRRLVPLKNALHPAHIVPQPIDRNRAIFDKGYAARRTGGCG